MPVSGRISASFPGERLEFIRMKVYERRYRHTGGKNAYFSRHHRGERMIDVTAAILTQAGRVLIARRKPGASRAGMWEFPGGKVRPGETPEEGLKREIREELGLDIAVGKFLGESLHAYADQSIRLLAYCARIEAGALVLHDHAGVEWVRFDELGRFTFCAADLPFVRMLKEGFEC